MPDDRLLHPKLLHSQKVNQLTDFERGVWLVCVLTADDFGIQRFSYRSLQEDATWLEHKSRKVVERALDVVAEVGLVHTFEHEGRTYCAHPDWQDYQKVEYPRRTNHPLPPLTIQAKCSANTRELYLKHPGGFRKKQNARAEDDPKPSAHLRDASPNPSDEITPKPLAVSREPLAVSRQPLSAAPDARSKRPVYTSDRLTVFEWQFDELSKMLGPHLDNFDLHGFLDHLTQQTRKDGLVIPKSEAWEWLQAQVLAEVKRRKLPIASAVPTARDKEAEHRAQADRLLVEIQESRRAGR